MRGIIEYSKKIKQANWDFYEPYTEHGSSLSACAYAIVAAEIGNIDWAYKYFMKTASVDLTGDTTVYAVWDEADKYSTTEHPRLVAGSVGPTTRNLTLANDTTAEAMAEVYSTVIRGLIDGGVDVILIETVMDARNASVAIEEGRKINAEIPIIVSAVLSRIEGRVASGATIAKFVEDLPMDDIAVIGFNCTNGVKPVESAVKALSAVCGKPIVAYPAAGQPLTAANRFCKELEQLCRAGMLNIVGGCCGTTPEYTSQMTKMAARWRPHKFERRR